ncbi:SMI1/KNR4 family protein [Paenibacillus sp. KQZ6P-2]|uniref:SMI1/KNR4 family protein n=1 Tax=Paenibacillus mangrovi TaxID=2931978 RepID=A0A9X1WPK8_9BACL|nr:SMI1/KNR4 family protein [Paenibacillus mangrovi]MCJ8012728.1 SMI1/KNR4 family protein [Paenibacillus mangrovi]
MKEKSKEFLANFEENGPIPEISIKKLEEEINFILPRDYFDFMLGSNGGEGTIGETYLALWKIEDLFELNEAYGVQDFAPGLMIIGSDGGDTAYCIDKRYDNKPLISVPFIGMDLNEVEICGNNFEEFLEYIITNGTNYKGEDFKNKADRYV